MNLKRTLVINIDGHDVKQLEDEGLRDMDAFVTVTADSEMNIMSSLVAKNHGVKKQLLELKHRLHPWCWCRYFNQ